MFSQLISYNIFLLTQGSFEDDLDGEDGGRRPPTPPQSSPAQQGGDRSRDSSPTVHPSLNPNRRRSTTTPTPSPERRALAHSNAQQKVVGSGQLSQQQAIQMPNANELTSSSQGSRGPPVLPGPPTLNSNSQVAQTKKAAPKRRRKNW